MKEKSNKSINQGTEQAIKKDENKKEIITKKLSEIKNTSISELLKNTTFINVLIILIFSSIVFGVLLLGGSIIYSINDDIGLKRIASGIFTGLAPSQNLIFSSFPFTTMLVILYKITLKVDWYGLFLLSCLIFFSIYTIYSIIKNLKNTFQKIIVVPLLLIFPLLIIPNLFNKITFTKVSGFIATCGLIIFLLPKTKFKNFIILISIIISYGIRYESCLMISVFYLPAWIYKNFDNKEELKKDFFFGCKILMILIVCILIEKLIIYNSPQWKKYLEYNEYRSEYYDYYVSTIENLPKKERADLYYRAGFTGLEVSLLLNYNIGLDTSIEDKIPTLIKLCEEKGLHHNMNLLSSAETLLTSKLGIIHLITVFILICILLEMPNKKQVFKRYILFFLFEAIILSVLIINGRIIERVCLTLYFGLLSINLYLIFDNDKTKGLFYYLLNNYKVLIASSCLILFTFSIIKAYIPKTPTGLVTIPLKYISEHPENYYIYNDFDEQTFSLKNKDTLTNYINIGGCTTYSPLYNQKLNSLGVNSLIELALKDNVYVILPYDQNVTDFRELAEDMEIAKIEELDKKSYVVYKFFKVER